MLGLAEAQTAPVIIPGILDLMDIPKERQDLLAAEPGGAHPQGR